MESAFRFIDVLYYGPCDAYLKNRLIQLGRGIIRILYRTSHNFELRILIEMLVEKIFN